jgi:hypothetical protein
MHIVDGLRTEAEAEEDAVNGGECSCADEVYPIC